MIDLCEDLCVVFDDDFVVVFVGDKVVDAKEDEIEDAVRRNVPELNDKLVRGTLDADVEDNGWKTRDAAAEKDVGIRVPEPVVRQVIDAVGD